MIPRTLVYFTTSLENTFSEARTQITSLTPFWSWSKMYICPGGCLKKPTKAKAALWWKQLFSLGWIQSCLLEVECLLPAFQRQNKSLTVSSYTIKTLQVLLQISKQPKVLTDVSLPLLPQVSGSCFFLELLWHTKQGTWHRHIYAHLSMNEKS